MDCVCCCPQAYTVIKNRKSRDNWGPESPSFQGKTIDQFVKKKTKFLFVRFKKVRKREKC